MDFPGPDGAETVIETYNSSSWDVTRRSWVELTDIKTITYSYDGKGRVISREITYSDGIVIEKTVYEYTRQGFRKTTYNHEGKIARRCENIRDNKTITETVFFPDGLVYSKSRIELNGAGLPEKSEQYDGAGKLIWLVVFGYDSKGNLKAALYHNPDGSLAFESSFACGEIDAMGNWTERTEYCSFADVAGRTKERIARRIIYGTN